MIWQFLYVRSTVRLELYKLDHISEFPEKNVKTQFIAAPYK